VDPLVVDLADPVIQQVVQLVQAGDRVPGRVAAAGDLDQELLLDGLEGAFDLAPAHRAPGLTVSQLYAQLRARSRQRGIRKAGSVINV
jgi:hypothetical protein